MKGSSAAEWNRLSSWHLMSSSTLGSEFAPRTWWQEFARLILNPCHTSPNIVLRSPSGFIPCQLLWVNTLLRSSLPLGPCLSLACLPPHAPPLEKNQTLKAFTIHYLLQQNGTCFLLKYMIWGGGWNLSHLKKLLGFFFFFPFERKEYESIHLLLNKKIF